jgi:hypothetical protein
LPDVQDDNPYAPPRADTIARTKLGASAIDGYTPLGWRTTAAAFAVCLDVGFNIILRVIGPSNDDAILELFLTLASAVFVLMWIYRAAKNLRPLGRYGMEHTPGWCVGVFFIPIASLWYPFLGMREIWKASDPAYPQGSWPVAPVTPMLGTWWGTYLASSLAGIIAAVAHQVPAIGIGSETIRGMAAVALIALMRGVAARQASIAAGETTVVAVS